jgi:hypothetical protein
MILFEYKPEQMIRKKARDFAGLLRGQRPSAELAASAGSAKITRQKSQCIYANI